jgi:hypothetical protein
LSRNEEEENTNKLIKSPFTLRFLFQFLFVDCKENMWLQVVTIFSVFAMTIGLPTNSNDPHSIIRPNTFENSK